MSPELRPQLPEVARRIGKARLLRWQSQLKGSEQQLRHSVQPRLWLEVLLLGLLAEPAPVAPSPAAPLPTSSAPTAAPMAPAAAPMAPVEATAPAAPTPTPAAVAPAETAPTTENLAELWQQILASLELPSTLMLLSQQAQLLRLDERRAVVRVAGTWMAMVQSRLPLLEKAVASALGSPRQLSLEAGGDGPASVAAPPPPRATAQAAPEPVREGATGAKVAAAPPVQSSAADPTIVKAAISPTTLPLPTQSEPVQNHRIDEHAQRLADFFNGEVIAQDGTNLQ